MIQLDRIWNIELFLLVGVEMSPSKGCSTKIIRKIRVVFGLNGKWIGQSSSETVKYPVSVSAVT